MATLSNAAYTQESIGTKTEPPRSGLEVDLFFFAEAEGRTGALVSAARLPAASSDESIPDCARHSTGDKIASKPRMTTESRIRNAILNDDLTFNSGHQP